ncbi:MAG: acetylneuraminic acid synthetase [Nitrospiraceae bacterium]|nr:acetylneuraminic acid synthetase [Nitrospiraceae bacterium]
MKRIRIGRYEVNRDKFNIPYIIAEAGVNHEGSMERAKQMIEEVSKARGHAIKFQAYRAETLASKYSPAYWDTKKEPTKSQYKLFKKYDKFWKEEFEELADYAKSYKVDFIVTPFDTESADFLEPLVPVYKIASADITNKPFLKYIAKKNKPIILSTGASTVTEIWQSLEWIHQEGNYQVILLHCVLNYPTDYKNANLGAIMKMRELFPDNIIGYSDHTLPEHVDEVLITAWLLGAQVIEKHYTWNKNLPGNDHYHSMDYTDLRRLIEKMEFIKNLIGKFEKHYLPSEEVSRKYARRSLVAKRNIPKGKIITEEDITWKRPGTGIPPWMIERVIGGKALDDIKEDEILTFDKVMLRGD